MKLKKDMTIIATAILLLMYPVVLGTRFMESEQMIVFANEELSGETEVESEDSTIVIPSPPARDDNPIEAYIYEVFDDEYETALAIAKAESGLKRDKENKSEVECSIGLFQINLAKDYCNGKWVHAGKVPGDTMDEKIEWLKNSENNVDMARRIYERSGFYPWSVYLNQVFKNFL